MIDDRWRTANGTGSDRLVSSVWTFRQFTVSLVCRHAKALTRDGLNRPIEYPPERHCLIAGLLS
jgi:hypothetical protein